MTPLEKFNLMKWLEERADSGISVRGALGPLAQVAATMLEFKVSTADITACKKDLGMNNAPRANKLKALEAEVNALKESSVRDAGGLYSLESKMRNLEATVSMLRTAMEAMRYYDPQGDPIVTLKERADAARESEGE